MVFGGGESEKKGDAASQSQAGEVAAGKTAEAPSAEGSPAAEAEEPTHKAAPTPVQIVSTPPGADVALGDGTALGKTPVNTDTDKVALGTRVTLSLKGYRDWTSEPVQVVGEGKPALVSMALVPVLVLEIKTSPAGAAVRLDGSEEALGTAPFSWTLSAAQQDALKAGASLPLLAELAGHRPGRLVLNQALSKSGVVDIKLEPAVKARPAAKKKRGPSAAKKPAPTPAKKKPAAKKSKDGWSF